MRVEISAASTLKLGFFYSKNKSYLKSNKVKASRPIKTISRRNDSSSASQINMPNMDRGFGVNACILN